MRWERELKAFLWLSKRLFAKGGLQLGMHTLKNLGGPNSVDRPISPNFRQFPLSDLSSAAIRVVRIGVSVADPQRYNGSNSKFGRGRGSSASFDRGLIALPQSN